MECKRCLNNEKIKGITFKDGVCSICHRYDEIKKYIEDYDNLQIVWKKKVFQYKEKGKYDAVIGLSGGKDSTYVLYNLVERYNLRTCCVTFDNGFLSDEARANVDSIVSLLGVKHRYLLLPEEIRRQVYAISEKTYGNQCMGCTFLMYVALKEFAVKNDVAMMINGRSQNQIYSKIGLIKGSPFHIFEESKSLRIEINEFFPNSFSGQDIPYLSYFMYHHYDEKEIVESLKRKFNWKEKMNNGKAVEHFDCTVHGKALDMFYKKNGYSQNLPEMSHMVRIGKLSKEEARSR